MAKIHPQIILCWFTWHSLPGGLRCSGFEGCPSEFWGGVGGGWDVPDHRPSVSFLLSSFIPYWRGGSCQLTPESGISKEKALPPHLRQRPHSLNRPWPVAPLPARRELYPETLLLLDRVARFSSHWRPGLPVPRGLSPVFPS